MLTNEDLCVPNIDFRSGKYKKKGYIQSEIRDQIWNVNIDFCVGYKEECWLDAGNYFFVFGKIFNVNIMLYNIDMMWTIFKYEEKDNKNNNAHC